MFNTAEEHRRLTPAVTFQRLDTVLRAQGLVLRYFPLGPYPIFSSRLPETSWSFRGVPEIPGFRGVPEISVLLSFSEEALGPGRTGSSGMTGTRAVSGGQ